MSTQVEERIVSMRFDNKEFESRAKTTLSTLDKLKEKLDFRGASKGISEIQKAADSLDLEKMGKGADAITMKFNMLNAIGYSAVNRVVNKLLDASEKLVKSFTITPVSSGWDKYARKTTAVQTIMAATAKEIENVDERMAMVNNQLEKLSWFTDETSYKFEDMVSNIGKFTSNNVGLQKSVTAMMGIANWAAISGSNANEASRAMYNLSQALGVGAVTAIDWKSIENANMATAEFKDVVIEAAAAQGALTKTADGVYKTLKGTTVSVSNFRETLSEKWFTSDVLMNALSKYGNAVERLYTLSEETGLTATNILEAVDDFQDGSLDLVSMEKETGVAAEELRKAFEALSTEEAQFSIKTFRAAQEAKTFEEAIDSVREAVSSGWSKTFELIFGDYLEAKKLWTGLANTLYDIFAESGNVRNSMLASWRELGGREDLLETLASLWEKISTLADHARTAFRDIFPPVTAHQLKNLTKALSTFAKSLELSVTAANTLKVVIKALLLPLKILVGVFEIGAVAIVLLIANVWNLANAFIGLFSETNGVQQALLKLVGNKNYVKIIVAWRKATESLSVVFGALKSAISSIFSSVKDNDWVITSTTLLTTILGKIADVLTTVIVFTLERIAAIDWNGIINTVKGGLVSIGDVFTQLYNRAMTFFANIKTASNANFFGGLGQSVDSLATSFQNVKTYGNLSIFFSNLKWTAGGLTRIFDELATGIGSALKQITPAEVMVFSFGTAMTGLMIMLTSTLNELRGGFGAFYGILAQIKKNIAASKPSMYERLAHSIILLAGALILMSFVDKEGLEVATTSMLKLIAAFTAASVLVSVIAAITKHIPGMSVGLKRMSALFATFSVAVIALASAMLLISLAPMDNLLTKVGMLIGLMVSLAIVSFALGNAGVELVAGAGSIIAFGAAVALMCYGLNMLNNVQIPELTRKLSDVFTIVAMMSALALMSGKASMRGAIGIVGAVLGLMLIIKTLQKLANMNIYGLIGAMKPLLILFPLLALVMAQVGHGGRNAAKMGVAILAITGAIVILGHSLEYLMTIKWKKAIPAIGYLVGALAAFGLLIRFALADKTFSENIARLGAVMISLGVSILLLSVALKFLSTIPVDQSIAPAIYIGVIMALFAEVIKCSRGAQKASVSIIAITAALGTLLAGLTVLSVLAKNNPVGVLVAATSIMTVLVSLGALIYAISKLRVDSIKNAASTIGLLIAITSILVVAVAALSLVKADNILDSATALSLIALTFAFITRIFEPFNGLNPLQFAATIEVILAIVAASFGILTLMEMIPNNMSFEQMMTKVAGISGLMLAIAGVSNIIKTRCVRVPMNILATISDYIMVAGVAAGLITVISLLPPTEGVIERAVALGIILATMAGAMWIVGNAKKVKASQISGNLAAMVILAFTGSLILDYLIRMPEPQGLLPKLAGFAGVIATLMGVGFVMSKFNVNPASIASAGVVVLEIIGVITLILLAVGFVAGGIDALIHQFSENGSVVDFINRGGEVLIAVGDAIGGFVGGIIGSFTGHLTDGLDTAAENLAAFSEKVKPFVDMCVEASKDSALLNGVSALLEAMVSASQLSMYSGSSLSNFGSQLSEFQEPFVSFLEAVSGANFGIVRIDTVVDCMEGISKIVAALPAQDGVLTDWFFGEKNLGTFGEQIATFGESFGKFVGYLADVDPTHALEVTKAAAGSLTEFAKAIPAQSGLPAFLEGQHDLGVFGSQILNFARYFKGFCNMMSGVNTPDGFDAAMDMANTLAAFANSIPTSGTSLMSLISGNTDLGEFGRQLSSFGVGYLGFAQNASTAPTGITSKVEEILGAVNLLLSADWDAIRAASYGMSYAGPDIEAMASYVAPLVDALAEVPDDVRTMQLDVAYKSVGTNLTNCLRDGIEENRESIVGEMLAYGTDILNSIKRSFVSDEGANEGTTIGYYLVQGIAEGINSGGLLAVQAAVALGESIILELRKSLRIHSPSQVARDEVGRWIVRGVAEGITEDMTAEEAAAQKASNIMAAFQQAFSDIDIDTQISDAELSLWQKLNPNASEKSSRDMAMENLTTKLENQAKRVELADAQYRATVQALGEGSKATKQAYLAYIQERDAMAELSQQMAEARDTSGDLGKSQAEKMVAYAKYISESKEDLLEMGFTIEEIQNAAAERTGFDPNVAPEIGKSSVKNSVQSIMDEFLTYTESEIELHMDDIRKKVSSGVGGGVSSGMVDGFGDSMEDITEMMSGGIADAIGGESGVFGFLTSEIFNPDSAAGKLEGFLNGISEKIPGFVDQGVNAVKGFFNGLWDSDELTGVENAGTNMADTALGAVAETLDSHSPSKETYKLGTYFTQGLVIGMANRASIAQVDKAAITVSNASLSSLKAHASEYFDIGVAYMSYFVEGILQSKDMAVSASVRVISDTIRGIAESLESGIGDDVLTIRPVLDTSDIESGIKGVSSMLKSTTGLDVTASYMKAQSASASSNGNSINGHANSSVKNVYNYTQNNYSPKALSRSEIYRQTNNQISSLKGVKG